MSKYFSIIFSLLTFIFLSNYANALNSDSSASYLIKQNLNNYNYDLIWNIDLDFKIESNEIEKLNLEAKPDIFYNNIVNILLEKNVPLEQIPVLSFCKQSKVGLILNYESYEKTRFCSSKF